MSFLARKRFFKPEPPDGSSVEIPVVWHNKKAALNTISTLAATGQFDSDLLDRLSVGLFESALADCKPLVYFLASLYLQTGQPHLATGLLRNAGAASADMKWFAAVMIHSLTYSLPVPKLSRRERSCLSYLQQHLLAPKQSLSDLIKDYATVAVLGNAPGPEFEEEISEDVCCFCFNGYRRNPRINGEPLVHVVTPSWKALEPIAGQRLCITGNNIFYRRSKVWRRFLDRPHYSGIHVLPQQLWAELNTDLKAPPSAGALILCYLAQFAELRGKRVLVGGFSSSEITTNHSYDRVPLSARHNWAGELDLRRHWLESISKAATEMVLLD